LTVLTAAEMREVDRRTIALGIPGIVLMENAGHRVIEFLQEKFAPLSAHRIVVFCGKGNNGGDGLVVARQLYTRFRPRSLDVVVAAEPEEMQGDAAANLAMLRACGCPFMHDATPAMAGATLIVDALLGTGVKGPASGRMLDFIRRINTDYPVAKVVAVDIPSGLASDSPAIEGEYVRAQYTVTFTALKVAQTMPPACDAMGDVRVCAIGSPAEVFPPSGLKLVTRDDIRHLFAHRARDANKGSFGHALIIAGAPGHSGAAAMCGIATLRAGAGLVTVAAPAPALPLIASYAPELMTAALDPDHLPLTRKTVLAIGPGLGTEPETVELVRRLFHESPLPMVVDADALNALAGSDWRGNGHLRVLTPHPGEMSRLTGKSIAEIQANRVDTARALARERAVVLILKGQRTLIAFPDGKVWINPTGTPAMATGGSGDILTGLITGLLAQFANEPNLAIAAAVYLHGLAGELGAAVLTEQCLIATDLLRFLPDAIHACTHVPDPL
jgi:hydroxyethylthiazole kinase-like uncharacterized protein yjeF